MLATGGGLVWSVHVVSRPAAFLLAVVLATAWVAPLAALQSLAVPRRAKVFLREDLTPRRDRCMCSGS